MSGPVFLFLFQEKGYTFDAWVEGEVSQGTIAFDDLAIKVAGLKFNFLYDRKRNILDISKIQGDVILGDGSESDQYLLSGDYVKFTDLSRNLIAFDLWMGDQSRDLVRVVGESRKELLHDGTELINFSINEGLSHFGGVHPFQLKLMLRDWNHVYSFNAGMDLRLETLLNDFQRVSKSGLPLFDKNIAAALGTIRRSSGSMTMHVNYKENEQKLSFNLSGEKIVFGDWVFKKCLLNGQKIGEEWHLENLSFDDLSASAYLKYMNSSWDFDRVVLKYGSTAAVHLNGNYLPSEAQINARIAFLDINLDKLSNCGTLIESFTRHCRPHGRMHATGELTLNKIVAIPGWKADAILNVSLHDWNILGLHFQDVSHLSCHLLTDKGITLRQFSSHLITPDTKAARGHLTFEKGSYEFVNGDIVIDDLGFDVPSHHLHWVTQTLSENFPNLFTPVMASMVRNSKLEGNLKGVLQYEYAPPYTSLEVKLNDGKYQFMNSEHTIGDFIMEYDPFEFKIHSKYLIGEHFALLSARSSSPTLSYGEMILTETISEKSPEDFVGK